MVTVTECTTLGKGRLRFHLDNGTELVLYRGEAKQFRMREGSTLSDEEEHQLIYEVVGKRAKRRTMHLLEQMDRTEQQLRSLRQTRAELYQLYVCPADHCFYQRYYKIQNISCSFKLLLLICNYGKSTGCLHH